jgi:hypothetical protein
VIVASADSHVPAIAEGDAVVAQCLRIGNRADRAHGLLATVQFGLAARALDLGRGELLADLAGGHALRLQRAQRQVHPHLPLDAADAVDRGHAFDAVQRAHHVAIDEPRQFVRGHPRRTHRVGQQRTADLDLGNDRFLDVLRQVHPDPGHRVLGVVQRGHDVRLEVELDGGGRGAFDHGGGDALDVVERRHRVLDLAGDLGFQLRRRRPAG